MKKNRCFLVLICLIAGACNSIPNTNGAKEKADAVQNQIEIEDLIIIPESFNPVFKIAKTEDLSYFDKGIKIKRIQQRILIPKGLSKDDVINNLRKSALDLYKEEPLRAISILAYYNKNEINKSYTIAMYEFCPFGDWEIANSNVRLQDYKENCKINKPYFENKKDMIQKGDVVILNRKQEWNVQQQSMIEATKTQLFDDNRSLSEEHLVAEFKNGTKAEVIEVYEEQMTGGMIWRVYKVRVGNSSGWVADFNVKKTTT